MTITASALSLGLSVGEGAAPAPAGASVPDERAVLSAGTDPSYRRERLVFADRFSGTRLNRANWSPYDSPGHAGNGLRRASALALDGKGHLVLTARMVAGQVVSGGMALRRSRAYGYYEFRVRTERDPTGTMSGVVLTWPRSGNWPADGELDMYETGNRPNTRKPFHTFVHFGSANNQYYYTHAADAAEWQTIAMEWATSAIKIYRNGALVWTVADRGAIPRVPHRLCIQLDAMTSRSLATPVRMYVDYVRIWRHKPRASRRAG